MDNKAKMTALVVTTLTFLPFWRSGGKDHLTFWGFVLNHTVFSPDPIEYVPKEDYTSALSSLIEVGEIEDRTDREGSRSRL